MSQCTQRNLYPALDFHLCYTNPDRSPSYCSTLIGSGNTTLITGCFIESDESSLFDKIARASHNVPSESFATSTIMAISFMSFSFILALALSLIMMMLFRPKLHILTGYFTLGTNLWMYLECMHQLKLQFQSGLFDNVLLMKYSQRHHFIVFIGVSIFLSRLCQTQTILRAFRSKSKRVIVIVIGLFLSFLEFGLHVVFDVEAAIDPTRTQRSRVGVVSYLLSTRFTSIVIPILFLINILIYTLSSLRQKASFVGTNYRDSSLAILSVLAAILPIVFQFYYVFAPSAFAISTFTMRSIFPLTCTLLTWQWFDQIKLNLRQTERNEDLGHRIDHNLYPKASVINSTIESIT